MPDQRRDGASRAHGIRNTEDLALLAFVQEREVAQVLAGEQVLFGGAGPGRGIAQPQEASLPGDQHRTVPSRGEAQEPAQPGLRGRPHRHGPAAGGVELHEPLGQEEEGAVLAVGSR